MSELILTLRQPAQIGDKARSDYVRSTQEYLPGTVARGAFAAAWIAAHGAPSAGSPSRQEFLRLFEGSVRFGPLFGKAEFMPLSVVGHKYDPDEGCQVVEYDRALQDGVPIRCPDCRSPLELQKGLRGTPIKVRRRTSVAISSAGVAERGLIVTRDTLEPDQSFRGALIATDAGDLDILAGLGPVRVGGRRTTHGAADVQIQDSPAQPAVERRDDGLLIVRLRSPGIFVDDQGRPRLDPDSGELEDVLGCPVRIARHWARWQTVGGWHIASGLPKPTELAAAAGSTYLLEPAHAVTDDALARLGRRGLGLRRHEGFGDLAPPPDLRPGALARQEESQRRQQLMYSIAPLRGAGVTRPELWQPLVEGLATHAAGDESATAFLRGMAKDLDEHSQGALMICLGMAPSDAAYVARELSKL